jgi:acetyl esterase/lipase
VDVPAVSMRAMKLRLLMLWLLLSVVGATPLAAAAWADVSYGVDGAEARLNIHAPAGGGPFPVIVWLGDGSRRMAPEHVARINATGHLLVSVGYPSAAARHPAEVEHVAAALAHVYRHVADYGGDPARLRVVGADGGAHLAALLAVDARWLGAQALSPDIIEGAVLVRPETLDLDAAMRAGGRGHAARVERFGERAEQWLDASPLARIGTRAPPLLVVAARDGDVALSRQRERFGDRLREAGVAHQTLLLAAGGRGLGTHFAALDDSGADAVFAWLSALRLPRLQRFEQLDFEADFVSGLRADGVTLRGAEVAFLFPFDGRLVASLADADPASAQPARVLVKQAQNADWIEARAFERARFTLLAGLRLQRDGDGAALPKTQDLLLAGLARGAEAMDWQWAGTDAAFRALDAEAVHALAAAAVHRDQVTGADVLLLGSRGSIRTAVWRGGTLALRDGIELDGADVAAFAVADGHAYAAVNGRNAGLYQRIDGNAARWRRVADLDLPDFAGARATAMSTVADPLGSGHDVLLVAHAGGRILRVDPMGGYGKTLEADVAAGFAEVWGGPSPAIDFGGNAFVTLRHPETADAVSAIGLKLRHPLAQTAPHNGAWYLLRQRDGSYSYGLNYDFAEPLADGGSLRSVRALALSPFVEDHGAAFYFGGFDAAAGERDGAWIYRGAMRAAAPRRGLWWDRSRSGHGVDLQPVGGRWMLTLATYDRDGAPVWYAALGRIDGRRFVVEPRGLTRYRYALDHDPRQRRDDARSGDVSIRFGLGHDQGACADGVDRRGALSLAELALSIDGRATRWCIEPMAFGDSGVPAADANGLWYAGPGDSGWGISIAEQGVDGKSVGVAYVYYYDAAGEPRWAMGSAPVVDGNARYALRAFRGACPGCAPVKIQSAAVGEFVQRLDGFCAAVGGTGSLGIAAPGDASRFVRERFAMNRLSTAACY